jgi:hypothetical protein
MWDANSTCCTQRQAAIDRHHPHGKVRWQHLLKLGQHFWRSSTIFWSRVK